MNTQQFINDYYTKPQERTLKQKAGGILPVSRKVFNEEINELKVDGMETRLLLNMVMSQLGMEVPEGIRTDAVNVAGMKEEGRAFQRKVDHFDSREQAYADGSLVEKFARFFNTPQDPRKSEPQPQQPQTIVIQQDNSRVDALEKKLNEMSDGLGAVLDALNQAQAPQQAEAQGQEPVKA